MALPSSLSNLKADHLAGQTITSADENAQSAATNALEARVIKESAVNVQWPEYAAVGVAGGDDTSALQAAITAGALAGKGAVLFPKGTYDLTATLTVPSGVTLIGNQATLRIKAGSTRDPRILQLNDSVTDVTIRGLTFDGNGTNFSTPSTTGGLIRGAASNKRISIVGNRIVNAHQYLIQFPSTSTTVEDLLIADNFCDGSGMDGGARPGIFLNCVNRGLIRNNVVLNTGDDGIALISPRGGAGGSTSVSYCRYVNIIGNVVSNVKVTGSNIVVTGEHINCIGNHCVDSKSAGGSTGTDGAIRVRHSDVDTAEYVARDIVVADNNIVSSAGPGISVSGARTKVHGNTIISPTGYGIHLATSDAAAAAGDPALPTEQGWVSVMNNDIQSPGLVGIFHTGGIARLRVEGNAVKQAGDIGFRLDLNTVAGRNRRLVVKDNEVDQAVGQGFRIGSSSGQCQMVTVEGNVARDCSTNGFDIPTQTFTRFWLFNNTAYNNTGTDWNLASATVPTDARNNRTLTSNVSAPSVPASGTPLTNPYGIPAMLYIVGGTVTNVNVDGVSGVHTATPCTVRIRPGGTVQLTYSVAPTWKWVLDA